MIEIAFLVDYPEAIPSLTHWFRAQWPAYYAERTPADIAQDFCSEANREGLPVRPKKMEVAAQGRSARAYSAVDLVSVHYLLLK